MSAAPAAVIGLEVHVQLRTATKLFCADENRFGAPPNTLVCPVCLGLPGALPVLNREAVALALRTAAGLGCTVHPISAFDRKSYFYPDLPKGYQITQYHRPLATGGVVAVPAAEPFDVRIRRVHLEEDAGRSIHDRVRSATAVDLNRAGVPLVEIVTEPDLATPAAARAFLEHLRRTLRYLGVSDGDMEKGSLRVDANVSLAGTGGARTELKNMNSFSALERALRFEIGRQRGVIEAGGAVAAETLLWDAARGEARAVRAKEESRDYRYFAEPDLPPLRVADAEVRAAFDSLPELPAAKQARLAARYELPPDDAAVLAGDAALADYFEVVAAEVGDGRTAAHWVLRDVLGWLNARGTDIDGFPVPPVRLAELVGAVRDGAVTPAAARDVLAAMAETGASAADLIRAGGRAAVTDTATLEAWVGEVVAAFPAEAARFRGGESRVFDFLMGQLMVRSRGNADPRRGAELLRDRLDG